MQWKNVVLVLITILTIITYFFDEQLIYLIAELRIPILDTIAINVATFSDVFIMMAVVVVLFLLVKRKFVVQVFLASVMSLGVAFLIKQIVARPRPYETLNIIPLIVETGYSFVSGHVIFYFALIPIFYFVFRKTGRLIWTVIAIVVLLSRLYLGVHYVTDVLASVVLGLLIGRFALHIEEVFFVRWKSLS